MSLTNKRFHILMILRIILKILQSINDILAIGLMLLSLFCVFSADISQFSTFQQSRCYVCFMHEIRLFYGLITTD